MKTKKFVLSGIFGLAMVGLVMTGCHKNSTSPDTDTTAAQDEASGQSTSTDAKNVSDNAVSASNTHGPIRNHGIIHLSKYCSSCTVTWSDSTSLTDSSIVTINFGSTPVYCSDGKYRQGEIIVSWPTTGGFFWSAYFTKGVRITQSFSGYKVGNSTSTMNGVAGARTWTNEGQDSIGYESWNFTANLTITRYNGKIFTWTSTRTNTLTLVSGAWYYEVTGSATGKTESGVTYNLNITSPLYVTALPWWWCGCPYIESGVITITRSTSTNTLSINYGTLGTCSSTATATLDGNTYTISKWW
jgi:hypothetical protein